MLQVTWLQDRLTVSEISFLLAQLGGVFVTLRNKQSDFHAHFTEQDFELLSQVTFHGK